MGGRGSGRASSLATLIRRHAIPVDVEQIEDSVIRARLLPYGWWPSLEGMEQAMEKMHYEKRGDTWFFTRVIGAFYRNSIGVKSRLVYNVTNEEIGLVWSEICSGKTQEEIAQKFSWKLQKVSTSSKRCTFQEIEVPAAREAEVPEDWEGELEGWLVEKIKVTDSDLREFIGESPESTDLRDRSPRRKKLSIQLRALGWRRLTLRVGINGGGTKVVGGWARDARRR